MKKILVVFLALLVGFAGIWVFKSKNPSARPDSYANGVVDEAMWWEVKASIGDVSDEWILDPEIPQNYLPVPGEDELYMVVDEHGFITKYRHRTRQADGSWVWEDVNPDIPDNYEPVEGLENVYRVTDKNGNVTYYKYIRNEDDTFAFVPCDETGRFLNDKDPEGEEIPDNYERLSGNVYAVKDENGVVIQYKERSMDANGNYSWAAVYKPTQASIDQANQIKLPALNPGTQGQGGSGGLAQVDDQGTVTSYDANGNYTDTQTFTTTETSGGWMTTYQTTVTQTYDSLGNLLSTKKDGPYEVSRVPVGNGGQGVAGSIAATLGEEVARISVGVTFNDDLAGQILSAMNAERAANGKARLTLDTSGTLYQLARARSAAMAVYDTGDYNIQGYGSLDEMCMKYGIAAVSPAENLWRTTAGKTADAVNTKFMTVESSRNAILSDAYTMVGISVTERNGNLYISEVFLAQ